MTGSFNPRILHPEWFVRNGLLNERDGADAVNSDRSGGPIVTPQVTRFDLGRGAQRIQVFCDLDRLQLSATTLLGETRLQELVFGMLSLLSHLPITAIGINSTLTFAAKDEAEWHAVGHLLAPKQSVWEKILQSPGLLLLQVQGRREGLFPGVRNVTVQPKGAAGVDNPCLVEIGVNCHLSVTPELIEKSASKSSVEIAKAYLEAEWKESAKVCHETAERILAAL
jgi:hypothetical protein